MNGTVELSNANSTSYSLAGWLAIISAVLLIPEIGLAVLVGYASPDLQVLVNPLHAINLLVGIYILYRFRTMLNDRFAFHKADTAIMVLIWTHVVFVVLGLVDLSAGAIGLTDQFVSALSVATLVLFVPFCLITIALGVTVLKLQDDLFGLLRPYAYTTMASGALGATIILSPLGLLAAVVALVMLGMIFLRAQRESEIL